VKRQLILLLSLIILVFLGQSALAAGASPEIKNIRVDGSSVKENETYVTQNNMVDITVEYLNAVKIKLGSEEVSVSESAYRRNYTFDDYLLKTGTNKLVIQVTGTGGTVKRNLTINCISTFIPNTEYITEMPANGKITVFENSVTCTFPKNSYIVDDDFEITPSQKMVFRVSQLEPDDYPSRYRTPVSNIIEIDAEDSSGDGFSNPGTVMIKYNDSVPEYTAPTLTIMYNDGSGWINIGAVVDGKKKTATTNFKGFGKYGVFNASRFFHDYNWARKFAEPLWAKGVMQIRKENGDIVFERFNENTPKFGLTNDCLRMDFASMIVRALGLNPVQRPSNSESRFTDLRGIDTEDKVDVETAAAYGIVEGIGVNRFGPKEPLTRAQAAVIIARVMKLPLVLDEARVDAELSSVFSDKDDFRKIPVWARPYVLACVKAKFINGIPAGDSVVFAANKKLNRGEAAKLVYLIMQANKRI
jgi:hypothetical protein